MTPKSQTNGSGSTNGTPTLSPLKRALLAVERMQKRVDATEAQRHEPIAIVGMSCRFPGGATSPDAFWKLLQTGTDGIEEVPPYRWDIDAYYSPDASDHGKMTTRWGGFVGPVDGFDASFFGISPREAIYMDPQQRLILEVTWEALEHAGFTAERRAGSQTGVFIGVSSYDYGFLLAADISAIEAYSNTSAMSVLAGRLAYFFDLHGETVAVDTACSSSLVALNHACKSLRNGTCNMALAGGVNLILSPEATISFSKFGMMAADGRCKTFDARADGYVRGEGCGVIVLKRLSDAVRDDDTILALVRGTAVNHGGKASGLTVPNGLAQQQVIEQALADGKLDPATITHIEAHGTGTSLGDPIEIEALKKVYGAPSEAGPCAISSIKTNIGHLEAAAGIAGIIKTVLTLQHQTLPPHLHLQQLNPSIHLDDSRFQIPDALQTWETANATPRRAGVSSFGFSGTNAHVVLEEAPTSSAEATTSQPAYLLPLSAKTPEALRAYAERYIDFLQETPDLEAVCYSASVRRTHLRHRCAVSGATREALIENLTAYTSEDHLPAGVVGQKKLGFRPKVAFVFSGQGAQYPGMAQALLAQDPTFRDVFRACDAAFQQHADWSLEAFVGDSSQHDRVDDTEVAQPLLCAYEIALFEWWKQTGLDAACVIGHSVGELAAAYAAGMLSIEEAMRLAYHRGRIMQQATGDGRMLAVALDEEATSARIAPYGAAVGVAALNRPGMTVISGTEAALLDVADQLKHDDVFHRWLGVNYAFHSAQMDPHAEAVTQAIGDLVVTSGMLPMISTVTGTTITADALDAAYWGRQLRAAVRFQDAVTQAATEGCNVFIEIGPSAALTGALTACLEHLESTPIVVASEQGASETETVGLRRALGHLYTNGVVFKWHVLYRQGGRNVTLPTYPWQRESYWFSHTPRHAQRKAVTNALHPLLHERVRSPRLKDIVFSAEIDLEALAYLRDHRLHDTVVIPAMAFLEMADAAAHLAFPEMPHAIVDFEMQEPLLLPDEEPRTLQCILSPAEEERSTFEIYSQRPDASADTPWTCHATGTVILHPPEVHVGDPALFEEPITKPEDPEEFYAESRIRGLDYGSYFQATDVANLHGDVSLSHIALPPDLHEQAANYQVHPIVLDACLHGLSPILPSHVRQALNLYLPLRLERYVFRGDAPQQLWCAARLRPSEEAQPETYTSDLYLFDGDQRPVGVIEGLVIQRISAEGLLRATLNNPDQWLYAPTWHPVPLESSEPTSSTNQRWLLLADTQGYIDALAQALADQQISYTTVLAGEAFAQAEAQYTINPSEPTNYTRLFESLRREDTTSVTHVVYGWGLDTPSVEGISETSLTKDPTLGCEAALHFVQALIAQETPQAPRFTLLTRGSQYVAQAPHAAAATQAPLWSFGKILALEHAELQGLLVDLDPTVDKLNAALLLQEITTVTEDQVAYRNGQRYVPRLDRFALAEAPHALLRDPAQPFALTIEDKGILDNLTMVPSERRAPGPREVEIEVRAAGLNFRDVLNAMDLYPGDAGPLGSECAGTIVAIGSEVTELQVGDEVLGIAGGTFQRYVTTHAGLVTRKPESLSFEDAAALPIVFLTAAYALDHLAKIQAGDRILIHSGSGGVGLAAIALAQQAGAEIFATAGSPEKRAFLKELGVPHVLHSRTLDFADDIRRITDGAGMDIVLNALIGDALQRSVDVLSDTGRFIEIGKPEGWDEARFKAQKPNAFYTQIDMAERFTNDPLVCRQLFDNLTTAFDAGTLQAPPVTSFPIAKAVDAFRFMAQAKHIGKIVLTVPTKPQLLIRPDSTYLITGGLGGLGRAVATRLIEQGAQHLALIGRNHPSEAAADWLAEHRANGVTLAVYQADVTVAADVEALFADIADALPPVRGIIHAAGLLDDGILMRLTPERFRTVMAPKVLGTWHLHRHSEELSLDFFVLFSSAAALLGSPGQANYVAGNAFMDALAHHRRHQHQPALSINWGFWAEIGTAAEGDQPRNLFPGIWTIPPDQGLTVLERLLTTSAAQVGVMPIHWPMLLHAFRQQRVPSFFQVLAEQAPTQTAKGPALRINQALLGTLAEATPEERHQHMIVHLSKQVTAVLRMDASSGLEPQQGLFDLGMDSLMAVELKNRLEATLGIQLSTAAPFNYPTIEKLAGHLVTLLFPDVPSATPEGQATDETANAQEALVADVQAMSEDEAQALIDAELATLLEDTSKHE